MAATEPWSPKKKPGTLELVKDDQLLEASSTQNKILKVSKGLPFPFLPLYSQYTFGQGLKTALPFSKLFLAAGTTVKGSPEKVEPKQSKEEHQIVHDKEQYMFRVILDEKGKSGKYNKYTIESSQLLTHSLSPVSIIIAALCYLPTRVRGLVEFYHTVKTIFTIYKKNHTTLFIYHSSC
jgi:hypothetical protein